MPPDSLAARSAPPETLADPSQHQPAADAQIELASEALPTAGASDDTRASRGALYVLAATPPALLLLFHAGRYYPFIADDALISLRYARRLVEGQGLT